MGDARMNLSPSGAHRWLHCTASPQFLADNADKIPDEEPPAYTAEGTLAHEFAGAAIMLGWEAAVASMPDTPEEIRDNVWPYVEEALGAEGELFIETRVPLPYMPQRNGYIDLAIVAKNLIRIVDLKYGRGVAVAAEQNPQAAIYAEAMIVELERKGYQFASDMMVSVEIYQPRCPTSTGWKTWKLTREELHEFYAHNIASVAENIMLGETTFAPSEDVCRFCEAKPFCSAYAGYLLEDVPSDEENLPAATVPAPSLPPANSLSYEQISKVLKVAKPLAKWLDEVTAYAVHSMAEGKDIPGFKLVEGKGRRTWTDDQEAEAHLRKHLAKSERTVQKVISPAQAEKALKGKELTTRYTNKLQKLIRNNAGKPTVAPEDDKRESIQTTVQQEFEDLT